MYLMDTQRDKSGFDDPVLSAEGGQHPMEVMEAQMSAIDDFYVDAQYVMRLGWLVGCLVGWLVGWLLG
jgi:hypothetical protein